MSTSERFVRLSLVLALVLSALVFVVPIRAQTPTFTPTPGCTDYPFDVSDGGWTAITGGGYDETYVSGQGWTAVGGQEIQLDIVSPYATITTVNFNTFTNGPNAQSAAAAYITPPSSYIFLFSSGLVEAGFRNWGWSGTATGYTDVRIFSNNGADGGIISWAQICGTSPIYSPTPTDTDTPTPTATPTVILPCSAVILPTDTPNWTPTGTLTDFPTGTVTPTTTPNFGTPTPTGSPPTATPPILSTPCVQPTPSPRACRLLSAATANFIGFPGMWTETPDAFAFNTGSGVDLTTGGILTTLQLNPAHRYTITVVWSSPSTSVGFSVGLGKTPGFPISVSIGDSHKSYTTPAQTYSPTSTTAGVNMYNLTISRSVPAPDNTRPNKIEFICVDDTVAPAPGSSGPVCSACTYSPMGGSDHILDDIGRLLNALFCYLWNFLTCTLLQLGLIIWNATLSIYHGLLNFVAWATDTTSTFAAWVNAGIGTIIDWVLSALRNLLATIWNSVAGVLSSLGLNSLLNALNAALLFGAVIFQTIINFVQMIINFVVGVVGLIIQIVQAFFNGFNSSNTIPLYAPACSEHATVGYYLCEAFWVLDHTVFDEGSLILYEIYIIEAFIVFRVFIWALGYISSINAESMEIGD